MPMDNIKTAHQQEKAKMAKMRELGRQIALKEVEPLPLDIQRLVLQHTDIPCFGKAAKKLFT